MAVRRAVSFADRVAASRDTTAIARRLEEANITMRPGEWVIVHALIAVLAGLLATLFTNFNLLLTFIAFGLGLLVPWMYLGYRADQRRKKFYDELPDANVQPAPRSQIKIRASLRDKALANCTFMRLGNSL